MNPSDYLFIAVPEINGLFVANEVSNWRKSMQDSIDNILYIEKTYKGIFPHLQHA
jgi:hypothetical protein